MGSASTSGRLGALQKHNLVAQLRNIIPDNLQAHKTFPMARVFMISGLGADGRLFKNIHLPNHAVTLTETLPVQDTDMIATYAQRIIDQYQIKPGDVVIGVSLGGIITIEIAKRVALAHAVLISSIKTIDEAPEYFRFFRTVPVYHLIPDQLFSVGSSMFKTIFGAMAPEDLELFKTMLKDASPQFMRWAMHAVLHWDNQLVPPNVYHIHGDADLVFPIRGIRDAVVIKGGTHIMVFDRADEINSLLKERIG